MIDNIPYADISYMRDHATSLLLVRVIPSMLTSFVHGPQVKTFRSLATDSVGNNRRDTCCSENIGNIAHIMYFANLFPGGGHRVQWRGDSGDRGAAHAHRVRPAYDVDRGEVGLHHMVS